MIHDLHFDILILNWFITSIYVAKNHERLLKRNQNSKYEFSFTSIEKNKRFNKFAQIKALTFMN